MKTVWCTKYVLTKGIIERELIEIDKQYAKVKWPGMINGWNLCSRGEWYSTLEEAEARALRMRNDRIKSLRKQISALELQRTKVIPLGNSPQSEP